MNLRILTFNWHEGYIHLLAKTGYEFDVVERWKGGRYGWIREFRPVPPNCNLISEDEAKIRLGRRYYDRIIAHNTQDFLLISEDPTPKILLHHNKFEIETDIYDKAKKEETLRKLHDIYSDTKNLGLVFVSKAKKDSWGLDGEVVVLSADLNDYGGYHGDIEKALRIGNLLKERDGLLGYSIQERILKDLPSTILGLNPTIEGAILPGSWDEFREFLRGHRVYLHTTTPFDDGYNCSMLEAMATGMPVVSISNPSSPIEDGINGFVSDDEDYLRDRIKELLKNKELARSIGQKARETVEDKFPVDRFIKEWKRILEGPERSSISTRKSDSKRSSQDKRLNILMSYTSNPQTTAAYMEKALRRHHDVMTYGPTIADEELKAWQLEGVKERVKDHDISYCTPDINAILEKLSPGWVPDLFLWVESGIWYPLEGIKSMECPTACYLIDVHLGLERRLHAAKEFDYVFIAQREYLPQFKAAGIEQVFWLPLACDPEIHGKKGDAKFHDIGFVGSLNNQRRIELLNKLKERFNVYYKRCFLERMAEVFSQSRIVFNISAKNDLNMRVFEALCSGSMLLTDEAAGSGLADIFLDRKHLVIYRDEKELFELADHYLRHPGERERIAAEGMKEVLNRHTYEQRVKEMLKVISSSLTDRIRQKGEDEDYFRQERREVEALIPKDAMRVLDVGCGEGVLGKRLLQRGVREVVGMEVNPEVAKKAENNLSKVICGDIEMMELPFERGYFDCIVFADILEHLRDPLTILKRFKDYLSDSGVIVASIPNVRYLGIIDMLVEGHWRYGDYGILDRTHLRFFTRKEIESLITEAGFELTGISANLNPQYHNLEDPMSGGISFGRISLKGLNPEEIYDLFVIQYLIRAEKAEKKEDILNRPSPASRPERLNILMASISSPVSSPYYYERALRRICNNVVTFGPYRDRSFWVEHALSLKAHQFYREGSATNWIDICSRLTKPCDIVVPSGAVDMRDILGKLPKGFRPDLFIWIDQHGENIPVNIDSLDCPTVALFGDTHIGDITGRLNYSVIYDYVFVMFNKHHIPLFKQAGCQKVFWSPAACDPEIHCKIPVEKDLPISFVGSTHPHLHKDRVQLLEFIRGHHIDIYIDSKVHQEMSRIFSRSKIVLNKTISDDLNQRVFEVLGAGSLLLTNRLSKESGLEDLFTDRGHLVIYDDPDSLIELIHYYLGHDQEREAIALAGYEEVLKRHTYDHRVQEIINIIEDDSYK